MEDRATDNQKTDPPALNEGDDGSQGEEAAGWDAREFPQPFVAACPECGTSVHVPQSPPAGELLQCPQCTCRFVLSEEGDIDQTQGQETGADRDEELDSLHIREVNTTRRAMVRLRAYQQIGVLCCLGAIAELVWMGYQAYIERRSFWMAFIAGEMMLVVAGMISIRYLARRISEVSTELKRPLLEEPLTPPDFSTLGNGSERLEEQVRKLGKM